ncbi:hypothetical protein [Arcobacter sp. LA11]|uniref:hypothetical protein n=1 Tax=Arcobacter sp. LA11 TaxID=1898176 RepID=UPI001160CAE3|nr:hypothetical protein [Arcobacter sp. LA11]
MSNNLLPKVFNINSKNDELFLSDDYFILYRDNRPFYYKKIENNLDINDLKLFIKNHLGIENIKISSLKKTNLNQNKKIDFKLIKAIKNHHFLYYIAYLSILVLFLIYFYINIESKDKKDDFTNFKTNIEDIKKDKTFTYISKEILQVYENGKSNSVKIKSILFENSKFFMVLESKKKDGIYKLLESIKNCLIEDMRFNKEEKKYEADVSFKILRN